ncbi:hypothetical protein [Mesorhizobium sp. B1-1-8]|nr:hypothetical protein [Mesorhizobium sp. B1-1-8]
MIRALCRITPANARGDAFREGAALQPPAARVISGDLFAGARHA